MQKTLLLPTLLLLATGATAQNVGIGTKNPSNKLEVTGNLLVQQPTITTNTSPTPDQQKNMINGSSISFSTADSTGRIYDPGGSAGAYLPNLQSTAHIINNDDHIIGYNINIESISLGTFDSLFIKTSTAANTPALLAVGNKYNLPGHFTFNENNLYIIFKSNADASVGNGFSLLFKAIYSDQSQPPVSGQLGKFFYFDASKGALRGGSSSGGEIGDYSVALGIQCEATSNGSVALGVAAKAGFWGAAIGYNAQASGAGAAALGRVATAEGEYATAIGNYTYAQPYGSTALGMNNVIGTGSTWSWVATDPVLVVGNGGEGYRHNALTILKNGRIGINTDAPLAGLTIKALENTENGHIRLENGSSGSNIYHSGNLLNFRSDFGNYYFRRGTGEALLSISTTGALIVNNATNSPIFNLASTGNLAIKGTLTQNSDARLKQHIEPVTNALDKVSHLQGYNYYWKDSASDPTLQSGLLAQEVQQYMPELVKSNDADELGVNYSGMVPYLVEAVKELKKENEQLQQLINSAIKRKDKHNKKKRG